MPILRPITTRSERIAYHEFRYAIYAESVQHGFLSGTEGSDWDEYDGQALHLGWYENDVLIGCVRLLSPIQGKDPLHLFKSQYDPDQREVLNRMLATAKLNGELICEVSRLCLAPSHRSLAATKQFVLAIIATAHRYGRDHCLFTCDQPHAPFWERMGFRPIPGFQGFGHHRSERPGCLFEGRYGDLLKIHRVALQLIGLQACAGMALAA
jgi:predicted GNAT family N-acyltransferase